MMEIATTVSELNNKNTEMMRVDNNSKINLRIHQEQFIIKLFFITSLLTIIILILTFTTIIDYAWPFLINVSRFWEIISENNWYTSDNFNEGSYGALAMIYGTFMVGIPAVFLSMFWGFSASIFLSEYMPIKITRIVQPILEFIAAIPSVIYGVIAFVFISEWVKNIFHLNSGKNLLTAVITLSFMASPIIASISIDSMQSTPPMLRQAAKAFGATRYDIFRNIVMPHAKNSMFSSILLAFGRILGETMVVFMVIGNTPVIRWSLLSGGYTLTAAIAGEFGDARFGSAEFDVLFVLALLLIIISFIVVGLSSAIVNGNNYITKAFAIIFKPISLIFKNIKNFFMMLQKPKEFTTELIERNILRRKLSNLVIEVILGLILTFNIGIVIFLLLQVLINGLPSLNLKFFVTKPNFSDMMNGQYGVLPAFIGSIYLVFIALIISIPISTITGIYLSEFAGKNKITESIKLSIININSLPSIVMGLFVYGLFSIKFGWGKGLLPGAVALGIMMIPIITTNTINAINSIPIEHKVSALALGATHWEAIKSHTVPYSFPSIITGYILAIGRVIGETAPLLLILYGSKYSSELFVTKFINNPVRVLPLEIFQNLLFVPWDAAEIWAFAIAIVLIFLIIVLNIIAQFLKKIIRAKYEYNGAI